MPSPNLVEPLPHPMRQLRSMPIRCLYSIYLFFLHAQSDGLCPSCLSTMPVRYRRDYLCSRESLLDHIHTVTRPPCHCIRMPLAFSVLHLFGRVVSSRQACCVLAFRVRLIIQCKLICVSNSCVSSGTTPPSGITATSAHSPGISRSGTGVSRVSPVAGARGRLASRAVARALSTLAAHADATRDGTRDTFFEPQPDRVYPISGSRTALAVYVYRHDPRVFQIEIADT